MELLMSTKTMPSSTSISTSSIQGFASRHIGPRESDISAMLKTVGSASLDDLIDQTIPAGIRPDTSLKFNSNKSLSEPELLAHLRKLSHHNKVYKSYIGLGYYNCHTPSVILRNVFENPGWYTQYTPYQAEISQGRLESL